jgi:hypothetical protein
VVFVTEDVAGKFRDWSERGVRFRHTPRLRRVKYQTPAADNGERSQDSAPTPIWEKCSLASKTSIEIRSFR